MKGQNKPWDRFAAISALVIYLISLFVSIPELRQNRKAQKLGVMLGVTISFEGRETNSFKIILVGSGLGPAGVKWRRLLDNDKEMSSWQKMHSKISLNTLPKRTSNIFLGLFFFQGARLQSHCK